MAWYPSRPITSEKQPSSGHQCTLWFLDLCVGHLSAVFTTSHPHRRSTEAYFASFLSSARSVTTSTNIDRQSHCPQCQGYQISIIGHDVERGERIIPVTATFHGVLSAGGSFCWGFALSQPASYWAQTYHLGSRLHIRYDTVLCEAFGGDNPRR